MNNQVMKADEILHQREQAHNFIITNLKALASEILDWKWTGVLPDGKLRQLADMHQYISAHERLKVAQSAVEHTALEIVSGHRDSTEHEAN